MQLYIPFYQVSKRFPEALLSANVCLMSLAKNGSVGYTTARETEKREGRDRGRVRPTLSARAGQQFVFAELLRQIQRMTASSVVWSPQMPSDFSKQQPVTFENQMIGRLGGSVVKHLPLAQVVILGSWD